MSRLAWTAALCAALLACGDGTEPDARPPNIVLVVGDDHGYPDFGFMGSPIARTPNLDRLAAEGALFRFGYVTASVCRPSLRTLLTGLYPLQYRLREQTLAERGISVERPETVARSLETLPRLLAERGYASFQAGKFHEGAYRDAGFSEGMNGDGGWEGRVAGERLVRETVEPVHDFIDRHVDRPFFLWFAPRIPHLPHDAPPVFQRLYRDADLPERARRYYASVTWFDDAVGNLLEHLDARGLRERTLVVYLADNGWDASDSDESSYAVGGPRGKKSLHELGFRTPILLRWPGRIRAGEVIDDLVSSADLFPTFLDYAGLPPLPDRAGFSLRPRLEGAGGAPREAIVGSMDAVRGDDPAKPGGGTFWRSPRWHYIAYAQRPAALYDLSVDPLEERDVAAEHPGVVRHARLATQLWMDDLRRRAPSAQPR